jgi:formylglycine-generating enzyme required for sulfatase activity
VFVDAFELSAFPVTRADYERFIAATGHEAPKDWSNPLLAHADLPVVGVSWHDAVAYCDWRSTLDGRPVRLPTEAEWEFAARGHQESLFPWGDVMPAWIPNEGRGPLDAPWPVTLGEPNDFGLFGIATNVHEWCADWWDMDYYAQSPEKNPAGPERGVRRASRGGAWRHAYTMCRVTLRSKLDPSFRYNDYGFRLAR